MSTTSKPRQSLYAEVTNRIVGELKRGCVPWVQPWDSAKSGRGLPRNGGTDRRYSGINILILWSRYFDGGFSSQRWLTYRQAEALGGHVRKGEQGTTVCYADHFTPKDQRSDEGGEGSEPPRQLAFLKRFTVFNVDQCEGLPERLAEPDALSPDPVHPIPEAEALIQATGATIRIGGGDAFYNMVEDYIRVPAQQAFYDPVDWYRTKLHELGHWSGHQSRLDRFGKIEDRTAYAREELVAEMACAFLCAELGIPPTVCHADYLNAWLAVLRQDERAIFRAASQASKACDYLLAFRPADGEQGA